MKDDPVTEAIYEFATHLEVLGKFVLEKLFRSRQQETTAIHSTVRNLFRLAPI